MKVFFVEYNHYEDHDFYSGWTTGEAAEKALVQLLEEREKELNEQPFWDKHCYYVQEYEVSE
jgi:hypothetical protein